MAHFFRGWSGQGVLRGGGYLYGYRLEGRVNARNSFGGYAGAKEYAFMFHDGEITAVWGEERYAPNNPATSYMRRLQ